MPDFLTLAEVSELLRVSRSTIYRWSRAGRLPGFKVGQGWRYSREGVEKLIRERQKAVKRASGRKAS